MRRKILIALTGLIVLWACFGVNKDPFESENVYFKKYTHTVVAGECLDEILARYYSSNTVSVDWENYRTKHYKYNSALILNGRPLQPNDVVVIYTVHKKEG